MLNRYAKKCPRCGSVTGLEAKACAACSHSFRTVFDPDDPRSEGRVQAQPLGIGVDAPPTRTMLVEYRHLESKQKPPPDVPPPNGQAWSMFVIAVLALLVYWIFTSAPSSALPAFPLLHLLHH